MFAINASIILLKSLRSLLIFVLLFFAANVCAQAPEFSAPRDLVGSSPTAAPLGTYGGANVHKSTGGIYKNIPLFQLQEGAIKYSPSLEYNSTGVRVDEWGGILGISWNHNFTPTIQRTVGTIPDEYSTQRLTEPVSIYFGGQPPTFAKYLQLIAACANANLANGPNNAFDPEYDVFSFNIFGLTGQFVIVNGAAILLTHSEKTKIEILRTSPTYSFCLTDINGFKYFFQDDIEYASLGVDGEVTPQLATTWFVTKIVSPVDDELTFAYGDMSYAYKSGFYQHLSYKDRRDLDVLPSGMGPGCNVAQSDFDRHENTHGVSRIQVSTKKPRAIVGSNFRLTFEYSSRQDLLGANLLEKIVLRDKDSVAFSNIVFEYDTYTAANTLVNSYSFVNDDLYPFTFGDGKVRYFLRSVKQFGAPMEEGKVYRFTYQNPGDLPPRLSLSQDEGGYFNGKVNQWFIPRQRIEESIRSYPYFWRFPMSYTGDRRPTDSAKAGILTNIVYPTGGEDSFEYELNTHTTTIYDESSTYYSGEVINRYTDGYYTTSTEEFDWVSCSRASIIIDWDVYNPETGISEQDLLGNHFAWIYLGAGGSNFRKFSVNGVLYDSIQIGLSEVEGDRPITLVFETENPADEFQLLFKLYGRNMRVMYQLTCGAHPYVGEAPFPGLRVNQIRTKSNNSPDMVKKYDYRSFQRQGGRLVYSSSVSSHVLDELRRKHVVRYFESVRASGCDVCGRMLYILGYSNSRYQPNVFGGNAISYSHVTEIQQNAFTASVFDVETDQYGTVVQGEPFFSTPNENTAWNNGLETHRFYGDKSATNYFVRKEQQWEYWEANSSPAVENCEIYQRYFETYFGCSSEPNDLYPIDFYPPFTIISYYLWHRQYLLGAFVELDYAGDGQRIMSHRVDYTHDLDGMLTKEKYTTSRNDLVERTIRYPKHINSGIYLSMSQENLLNFRVEETVKLNGSVIVGNLTSYRSENGKFLRDHVYSVATDGPLNSFTEFDGAVKDPHYGSEPEVEYIAYNSAGRVTKTKTRGGVFTYYVWGYNNNYPVARIESPNNVSISVSVNDNNLSSSDNLASVKSDISYLKSLLSAYVNDSQYRVTLYTYMPLAGITSQTDPNGLTAYFEYDDLSRLATVRDKDDNIVRIHEYSYAKNQPNPALNFVRTKNIQAEGLLSLTQAGTWGADKIQQSTSYFDGLGRAFQEVIKQGSPSFKDVVIQKIYDRLGRDSIAFLPYTDGSSGAYKISALRDPSDDTPLSLLERYRTGDQYLFYQTGAVLAQDQYPYSRTVFEPNPLSRVAKQGAPGAVWQPKEDIAEVSDKSIKIRYDLNQAGEVVMFDYDPASGEIDPTHNGELRYYQANQLQIIRSFDAHNNEVVEYVDKQGLTVLKRVQYETDESGSGGPMPIYADTYYIYDELSNLVVVLPPEAVRQILAPFTN